MLIDWMKRKSQKYQRSKINVRIFSIRLRFGEIHQKIHINERNKNDTKIIEIEDHDLL